MRAEWYKNLFMNASRTLVRTTNSHQQNEFVNTCLTTRRRIPTERRVANNLWQNKTATNCAIESMKHILARNAAISFVAFVAANATDAL